MQICSTGRQQSSAKDAASVSTPSRAAGSGRHSHTRASAHQTASTSRNQPESIRMGWGRRARCRPPAWPRPAAQRPARRRQTGSAAGDGGPDGAAARQRVPAPPARQSPAEESGRAPRTGDGKVGGRRRGEGTARQCREELGGLQGKKQGVDHAQGPRHQIAVEPGSRGAAASSRCRSVAGSGGASWRRPPPARPNSQAPTGSERKK